MTVRNDTQLASQITTLLADNTSGDISAADLRSILTDIRDSLGPPSLFGLPNASEAYEGRVLVNEVDRRAYICENEPHVATAATAGFNDLSTYYTTDDANLRIFHDLPAATSSDDDTWIYVDSGPHVDKFYFGDTAPGSGNYAWYEDSPRDALLEVCLAYVENATTSLTDMGQTAVVNYMGQRQDDTDARDYLHRHTVSLTTAYWVYWSLSEQTFKILDSFSAAGTTTDHYRWRNLKSEALNPIYRPRLDGTFPVPNADDFEENAILIDIQGLNWHIKHTQIGTTQSARGTWTGYGPSDTLPGLPANETWRGIVDNTGQVTSPSNGDVCGVRDGTHLTLYVYFTSGQAGWYVYNPIPFDRVLGVFGSLEEADGAVGTFTTGTNVYCAVGYRLYRLTAFTPGTSATHTYSWERASSPPPTARGAYLASLTLETPTSASEQISQQSNWTLQTTAPAGWEIRSQGRLRTPGLANIAQNVVGFWIEAYDGGTNNLASRSVYPLRRYPNVIDSVSTGFFHSDENGTSRVIPQIISYVGGFFEIEFYSASQASGTSEFQRIGDSVLRIYEWLG